MGQKSKEPASSQQSFPPPAIHEFALDFDWSRDFENPDER
jgi:hypothetical protein